MAYRQKQCINVSLRGEKKKNLRMRSLESPIRLAAKYMQKAQDLAKAFFKRFILWSDTTCAPGPCAASKENLSE